jgi:dolichyl-phosphate beta-glucosyltransferase
MDSIYLSVVIPAYNEEKRIGNTCEQIVSFLARQPYVSETIVVDDGSRDRTAAVAEDKLAPSIHRILQNPGNRGKGYAVKQGMLAASGKYVLFTDADLSTPIEEVQKFLKSLEEGYDIVIGSRSLEGSNIEIRQNLLRQSMGKIFNRLARLLTFRSIRDSQCGFKCFKRKVAQDLFSKQQLDGFSFDAEIIYLAQRQGYRIFEMPVTWRNSPHSRVRIVKDSLGMFLDLWRIRWMHRHPQ